MTDNCETQAATIIRHVRDHPKQSEADLIRVVAALLRGFAREAVKTELAKTGG